MRILVRMHRSEKERMHNRRRNRPCKRNSYLPPKPGRSLKMDSSSSPRVKFSLSTSLVLLRLWPPEPSILAPDIVNDDGISWCGDERYGPQWRRTALLLCRHEPGYREELSISRLQQLWKTHKQCVDLDARHYEERYKDSNELVCGLGGFLEQRHVFGCTSDGKTVRCVNKGERDDVLSSAPFL